MATSFQPEQPHDPAKHSSGKSSIVWTALISAVLVTMLFAVGLPHFVTGYEASWLLTLGAGVLTFFIILVLGLTRTTRTPVVEKEGSTST